MADNTRIEPAITDSVKEDMGKAEGSLVENDAVKDPVLQDDNIVSSEQFNLDSETPDSEESVKSKSAPSLTGSDFYDNFVKKQEAFEFASDLQSADTYWENRPEDRAQFEQKYGDKAKEKFVEYYDTEVEPLWRKKLDGQTELAVMNSRYEWLFGQDAGISYDNGLVAEVVTEIYNGSRKLDTIITDKTMSDKAAALSKKTYLNDQGELVVLEEGEKFWEWSRGEGFKMNRNDPKHLSADGREIVGFTYETFDPEFRGDAYIKAVYENDIVKDQLVSMWDTTNTWLNGTNIKESAISMLPRTAIRTTMGALTDITTGTISLLGSAVQLLDADDKNAFVDWANNTVTSMNSLGRVSKSEYDSSKTITMSNALDLVTQIALQLYTGMALFKGGMGATKLLLAKNPLLTAANAAKKAGDVTKAGKLISQFEMQNAFGARAISLLGLTLQTGNSVVTEARAAGFGEDEVAAIYLSYFAMMLGANQISMRMLDPYFTNATAAPFMRDIIKKEVGTGLKDATTDVAKMSWAKGLVQKMADGVKKLPSVAGHTETSMGIRSMMAKSLNEAMEEEVEYFGQEGVELLATQVSKRRHKGEENIPKFDTFLEKGYWSRQLPEIILNGLGGAIGGSMTHFMPGFAHPNENSFLIKGDDQARMMKVMMAGGQLETSLMKQINREFKSGAMGSHKLSVKMNDKTGTFYKMTDAEAQGTLSHAEAARNAIINQAMFYKTLYGNTSHTYDEIIKLDPKLTTELEAGSDHVLYRSLVQLHQDKRNLLQGIMTGDISVKENIANKERANSKKAPKKSTTPEVDKTIPGSAPGVTSEPSEESVEATLKLQEKISKEVEELAQIYGTTDYTSVEKIIDIQTQIDDILSGNAAAKQVAKSFIRNHKIKEFMGTADQKEVFSKLTGSDGKEIDSPFSKFGDNLLDMLFSADANLAKGHSVRHSTYIANAEVIKKFIDTELASPERMAEIANGAKANPGSIAIDRDTDQLQKLADGMNAMISKLIGKEDFELIVSSARTTLGITGTTEEYNDKISELYYAFLDAEFGVDEVTDEDVLTKLQVEKFIGDNIDLIQKSALSTYIDMMSMNPSKLLIAKVNLDKSTLQNNLIEDLYDNGAVTASSINFEEDFGFAAAVGRIGVLEQAIVDLKEKVPETSIEKIAQERKIESLRQEKASEEAKAASAKRQADMSGPLNFVVAKYGAVALDRMTSKSKVSELVPVVNIKSDKIVQAQNVIENYNIIINNISPIVPTIQKLGAVTNLLNEISVDGTTLVSTITKIIAEDDSEQKFTITSSGVVIPTNNVKSKLDELKSMVLNEGTNVEEFRSLDTAKLLLDTINIRLAQVEVIKLITDSLVTLRSYTKKHIPLGNTKYDQLPKFMAEYIYDPERLHFLASKASRNAEEEEDFTEIALRKGLIENYDSPHSIYSRLNKAKESVQQLITLGEKSLKSDERLRVYKTDVANELNNTVKSIREHRVDLRDYSADVDAAVVKLSNISDKYTESSPEALIAGRAAMQELLIALHALPLDKKLKYVQGRSKYAAKGGDNSNLSWSSVDAMTTDPTVFDKYYDKLLADTVKGIDGAVAPTYSQEHMIRSVFSFITDETNLYKNLSDNKYQDILFVDGGSGTGKTVMIGYGLTTAQERLNERVKESLGASYDSTQAQNEVLFAANYSHQAQILKDKAIAVGVRAAKVAPLSKSQLFQYLENDGTYDNISTIVFDEATFIQAEAEAGKKSELEYLQERLSAINISRAIKKLPRLKLVAIGDDDQGGWQVGMPTIFDTNVNWDKAIDYNKIGAKTSIKFAGLCYTQRLTYTFRSLCEKIKDANKELIALTDERYSNLFTNAAISTKIMMSSGTISNDDRKRLGGVETVRDTNELYNGQSTVDNISAQITIDPAFNVLIIDNDIRDIASLPDGALKNFAKSHTTNFTFRSVESAQGAESDYVIANLMKLFPQIPLKNALDSAKLEKVAMVISRARLYAKIAIDPSVNVEQVDNTIITMLSDKDASKLSTDWNDFYINELRGVTVEGTARIVGQPAQKGEEQPIQEGAKKETTTKTSAGVSTEEKETSIPPKREIILEGESVQNAVIQTVANLPKEDAVVINGHVITPAQVAPIIAAADAIILSADSTPEQIKVAQEEKAKAQESVVDLIDVSDSPAKYTEDLEDNLIPESEPLVRLNNESEDNDKKNAAAIEEHGYAFGYGRFKQELGLNTEITSKAQFASDLYGSENYKIKTSAGIRITDSAQAEIQYASERLMALDFSEHEISLVSFETLDPESNTMVVVHEFMASRNGIKVPISMIATLQLRKSGVLATTLNEREATIKQMVSAMTLLHKTESTTSLFGDRDIQADAKSEMFGPAGVPFEDNVLDMIQGHLDEDHPGVVFPRNNEVTKLGRVMLSDQHPKYSNPKIIADRRDTGLFYMETVITNPEEVFVASTPGKLITSPNKAGRAAVANLFPTDQHGYLNSLPDRNYFTSEIISWIKDVANPVRGKWRTEHSTTVKTIEELNANTKNPLHKFTVEGKEYPVLYVTNKGKTYKIISVVGANGRKTALFTDRQASYEVLYGFDAAGLPIKGRTPDLEASALISAFGINRINNTEATDKGILSPTVDVTAANKLLGIVYNYNAEEVSKIPDVDLRYNAMSESYLSKPIIPYSDLKLSLKDFRELSLVNGLQVSPALVFTRVMKDNHAGKSYVLYTYDKTKDLSDPKFIAKHLAARSQMKATDVSSDKFNVMDYAGNGIGVILLDTKPETIKNLVTRLIGSGSIADVDRATTPSNSVANRRMVSLVKDLAEMVQELEGGPTELHTRLAKLAVGKDKITIFSANNRKKIMAMLSSLKNNPETVARYNSFSKFLQVITLDSNMGKLVLSHLDVPGRLRTLLEKSNPIERQNYWRDVFENGTATAEEAEYIKNHKDILLSSKLTSDEQAVGGLLSGGIVINPVTKHPLISNTGSVITFVPSISIITGEDNVTVGGKAVFNMTNFIKLIANPSISSTSSGAESLADLIDVLMRDFSEPGTLRKGLMWSGRLSTELGGGAISTAMLNKADSDELLLTSVKEVNPPATIINISSLIGQLTATESHPVVQNDNTEEVDADQERDSLVKTIASMRSTAMKKAAVAQDYPTKILIRNSATADIIGAYSDKEGLYDPAIFTTMVQREVDSFKTEFDKLYPKLNIPAAKPGNKKVEALIQEAAGYSISGDPDVEESDIEVFLRGVSQDAESIIEINAEVAADRKAGTPNLEYEQQVADTTEAFFRMLDADQRLEGIREDIKTDMKNRMNMVQLEPIKVNYGSILMDAVVKTSNFQANTTEKQKVTFAKLHGGMALMSFTKKQLAALEHLKNLAVNPEVFELMEEDERAEATTAASNIELEIAMKFKDLGFSNEDIVEFGSILEFMERTKC